MKINSDRIRDSLDSLHVLEREAGDIGVDVYRVDGPPLGDDLAAELGIKYRFSRAAIVADAKKVGFYPDIGRGKLKVDPIEPEDGFTSGSNDGYTHEMTLNRYLTKGFYPELRNRIGRQRGRIRGYLQGKLGSPEKVEEQAAATLDHENAHETQLNRCYIDGKRTTVTLVELIYRTMLDEYRNRLKKMEIPERLKEIIAQVKAMKITRGLIEGTTENLVEFTRNKLTTDEVYRKRAENPITTYDVLAASCAKGIADTGEGDPYAFQRGMYEKPEIIPLFADRVSKYVDAILRSNYRNAA